MKKSGTVLAAACVLICGLMYAQTSRNLMNVQGRLFNVPGQGMVQGEGQGQGQQGRGQGQPVTGNLQMIFRFYTVETGGTANWFEGPVVVSVSNGYYNYNIGLNTSGGIPPGVFNTANLWLEMQVGSEVLSPRVRITSVPYAWVARSLDGYTAGNASGQIPLSNGILNQNLNADLLDGVHADNFAAGNHHHDALYINDAAGEVNAADDFGFGAPTFVANMDSDLLDGHHASAFLPADNIAGTAHYLSLFTGSKTLGDSQIYDNGNSIGIGTTQPEAKLHVAGIVRAEGLEIPQNYPCQISSLNVQDFSATNGTFTGQVTVEQGLRVGLNTILIGATAAGAPNVIEFTSTDGSILFTGGNGTIDSDNLLTLAAQGILTIETQGPNPIILDPGANADVQIRSDLEVRGDLLFGAPPGGPKRIVGPNNLLQIVSQGAFPIMMQPGGVDRVSFEGTGMSLLPAAAATSELRLLELPASGVNYAGFRAPNAIAANLMWTLPAADGLTGQVLTTDGAGLLSWAAAGAGVLPPGISGQTLRHDGTTWVANSVLFNDGVNVGIGTTTPTQPLDVAGNVRIAAGIDDGTGFGVAGYALKTDGLGDVYWGIDADSGGTVTSISPGVPGSNTAGSGLTFGSDPIITTGSIALSNTTVLSGTYGATDSVSVFTVDAQGRLTAAWDSLIAIDAGQIVSGTLAVARGGTGLNTVVTGDILYGSAADTWDRLPAGAVDYVLKSNGPGTAPSWDIDADSGGTVTSIAAGDGLTAFPSDPITDTGIINVGAGTGISVGADTVSVIYGTVAGTVCAGNDSRLNPFPGAGGRILYDDGAAWTALAAGTSGQFLRSGGSGAPYWDTFDVGDISSFAFVQDGNSFGVEATLGTNDAQSLAFETNNVQRMWIDTAGNVTIGTPLLPQLLDMNGNVRITGGIDDGSGFGMAGYVLKTDGLGDVYWDTDVDSGGTITSISAGVPGSNTAGSGLTFSADPITTTGSIALSNTTVLGGTYGAADSVGVFTVDVQGRLTAAWDSLIAIDAGQIVSGTLAVSRGGTGADLSGTGGLNQFVKQALPGAAFTVGPISADELPAEGYEDIYVKLAPTATQTIVAGGPGVAPLALQMAFLPAASPFVIQNAALVPTFEIDTAGAVTAGMWQATPIGAAYGGTGQTTVVTGDLLYGSAADTWSRLPAGAGGYVLKSNGPSTVPSWQVDADAGGTVTSIAAGDGLTAFPSDPITDTGIINVGAGTGISVGADTVSVVYGTVAGTVCAGNDSRLNPFPGAGGRILYDDGAVWTALSAGTNGQFLRSGGSGAPYWDTFDAADVSSFAFVQNGNSFGVQGTLGTNDAQSLAFETNNVQQMWIDTTGNVGIGTSTPGARLEVNGQVKITGGNPGTGKVLTSDADGDASWETPGNANLTFTDVQVYYGGSSPAWTVVDLSPVVGVNRALVLLKVKVVVPSLPNIPPTIDCRFRECGETDFVYGATCPTILAGNTTSTFAYVWILTDAQGKIEFTSTYAVQLRVRAYAK